MESRQVSISSSLDGPEYHEPSEYPEGRAHNGGSVSMWGPMFSDSYPYYRPASTIVSLPARGASKGTWAGRRADPDESAAVTMRKVMNLPMSPRARSLCESALACGGDLAAGATVLGMSKVAVSKELRNIRQLALVYGLVVEDEAA